MKQRGVENVTARRVTVQCSEKTRPVTIMCYCDHMSPSRRSRFFVDCILGGLLRLTYAYSLLLSMVYLELTQMHKSASKCSRCCCSFK